MRNDVAEDVLEPTRFPFERAIAAIRPDRPASEQGLDGMKHLGSIAVLADGEARPHLPSHPQSSAWCDGNGEAAFAVDVSGDVCREELATVSGAGV